MASSSLRWAFVPLTAVLVLAAAGLWLWLGGGNEQASEIAAGRVIYANNCAACHGTNLEGQPDWRSPLPSGRLPAPPHDASGHTWHHSNEVLFTIVRDGFRAFEPDYQTDMPTFAGQLTDAEIRSVIEFIKSTWPRRQREVQAGRTAAGQ